MPLENLVGNNIFITNLVPSNPLGTDPESEGDDHLRGIKNAVLNSFPNINGVVTATPAELNSISSTINKATPIGSVILWTTNTPPAGFLKIPAAATNLNRVTYAALFAAIGTTWGAGDGSTTFGIPFIPAGYLPGTGAAVAVQDVGQVIAHDHVVNPRIGSANGGTGFNTGWNDTFGGTSPRASSVTGGAINRAAQVSFNYCIRFE